MNLCMMVKVLGKDYKENEKEIKQNIGVVFDSNFFVDTWTIKETEQALSVFYHEWNNEKFRLILKRFGLPLSKKINELSRGMQMKLMLACAFSHNCKDCTVKDFCKKYKQENKS